MEVFGFFLFLAQAVQFSNDVCGYEFGWPYLVLIPFFIFLGGRYMSLDVKIMLTVKITNRRRRRLQVA